MLQKTSKVLLSILALIVVGAISYVGVRSLGNKKIEKDKNLTNQVNNNLEPTDTNISNWKTFKRPNDEKYSIKYPAQWVVDTKDSYYIYDPKFNKPITVTNIDNSANQNNVLGMSTLYSMGGAVNLQKIKENAQKFKAEPTNIQDELQKNFIKEFSRYVDFIDGKISLAEFAKTLSLATSGVAENNEILNESETEKSYTSLVTSRGSTYIGGTVSDKGRTKLFQFLFSCPNKEMLNYCGEIFTKMLSTFQY